MSERPEPKFKAGQIVVLKSVKKELPFRILGTLWQGGWFYQWNKSNYASEGMVRALTEQEINGEPMREPEL